MEAVKLLVATQWAGWLGFNGTFNTE